MTIVHKAGDKQNNADCLSRWALPNTPDDPALDPEDEDIFTILGIHVCDLDEAFYELVRSSYKSNFEIFKLVDILNDEKSLLEPIAILPDNISKSYSEGKFTLLDGLIYYRYRHKSVLVLCDQNQIDNIPQEFHDHVNSGHLYE